MGPDPRLIATQAKTASQIVAGSGSGTASAEPLAIGGVTVSPKCILPEIVISEVDGAALVAVGLVAVPEDGLAEGITPDGVVGRVDDSVAVVVAGDGDVAHERRIEKLAGGEFVVGERHEGRHGITTIGIPRPSDSMSRLTPSESLPGLPLATVYNPSGELAGL